MSRNDDDEALTWAGARDPSHYETPEAKPQKPVKPVGAAATTPRQFHGTDESDDDSDDEDAAPSTSAAVLVSLGILGGIYLLYTIGWFISWQRFVYVDTDALELAAFRAQQVLAILAPPLWFIVTMVFTRGRKPAIRLLLLLVGAIVLVPWSFTFGR